MAAAADLKPMMANGPSVVEETGAHCGGNPTPGLPKDVNKATIDLTGHIIRPNTWDRKEKELVKITGHGSFFNGLDTCRFAADGGGGLEDGPPKEDDTIPEEDEELEAEYEPLVGVKPPKEE